MLANPVSIRTWRKGTADPSAWLGMTKGRVVAEGGLVIGVAHCRSLGFARDDKRGEWWLRKAWW
jgi:hypothetical protein